MIAALLILLFVGVFGFVAMTKAHERDIQRLRDMGCICELSFLGPVVDKRCAVHGAWDEENL